MTSVIPKEALEIIKHFEGLKLNAYICPAGKKTIGWGHTGLVDGKKIVIGLRITQSKAEELLNEELLRLNRLIQTELGKTVLLPRQMAALLSLTFNIGIGAFRRSTLLKNILKKDYNSIPSELRRWNKSKGRILAGLVRRREAEARLWNGEKWQVNTNQRGTV